ncbi:MAG: ECF transporter S component [Erysipelotrichaceae bacterium]|nr:ECF transporter S component [Erysipelotrichaceae bacterium]
MQNEKTKKIAALGILTAIVVVLQLLGSFIRFGQFSISLVLIPIVVGAALFGPAAGAWLGFVFSVTVLASGDAAPFLAVSVIGTVLTVIGKGTIAGLVSGIVYKFFHEKPTLAAVLSAIACPVCNTGIFLIGCFLFFMPTISAWAEAFGFASTGAYILLGLVGGNFLFEVLTNVILSPVIVRVISMGRNQ